MVKYFVFDYAGWLRVSIISQHKKSSKYAGSVNVKFLDIDKDPKSLYFWFGDFWSILQDEEEDLEPLETEKKP